MNSTPSHNIFVEVLIPTKKLLVLLFHGHKVCVNYLILVGVLHLMNKNISKELVINFHLSPIGKYVID